MAKVTVHDIAKEAGVAQSTVSKVLNDYPEMKAETKEKVNQAIKHLKYTPDIIARSMVTNKTNTIGLVVGDISNPFFAESAKIIIKQAEEQGYHVIISNTDHMNENLDSAISTLLSKRVDGIIISSTNRDNNVIQELYNNGFPVVLYNSKIEGEFANSVILDNEKGAELAVKHLLELGHQDIGFISGPSKYMTTHDRYLGFKKTLKNYNITIDDDYIYKGEYSYENVFNFTYQLLNKENRPSCIFATSDQMAFAVMDAASKLNIKIPEQLSVIGFDDMSISSNHFIGLTTISQQKEKMALLSLKRLLSLINEEDSEVSAQITLKPKLIIRKTTSVPFKKS